MPEEKICINSGRYHHQQAERGALRAQGDNVVINLASDEYFKSVKPKKLNAEIIKPVFLDEKERQI